MRMHVCQMHVYAMLCWFCLLPSSPHSVLQRPTQVLASGSQFDDVGPCVVLAAPAMLQSGFSRQLLEMWCGDPANGVVLADFHVQGTLARELTAHPEEIPSLQGYKLPMRAQVRSCRCLLLRLLVQRPPPPTAASLPAVTLRQASAVSGRCPAHLVPSTIDSSGCGGWIRALHLDPGHPVWSRMTMTMSSKTYFVSL